MDKELIALIVKKSGATTPSELYQYVQNLADILKRKSLEFVIEKSEPKVELCPDSELHLEKDFANQTGAFAD